MLVTYLHSNMFLLKYLSEVKSIRTICIYIPICFYLNGFEGTKNHRSVIIYIPICFYLNE